MVDQRLRPVYLGKVDLADAYMWLWVRLKDTPSAALLLPKKRSTDKHLVGFHLSLSMGYVDSTPYFCMSTETISNIANVSMGGRHKPPPHTLEGFADSPALEYQAPNQADNEHWRRTPTRSEGAHL